MVAPSVLLHDRTCRPLRTPLRHAAQMTATEPGASVAGTFQTYFADFEIRTLGEADAERLSLVAGAAQILACREQGGTVLVADGGGIVAAAGACISGQCVRLQVTGLANADDDVQKELLTFLVRCVETVCARDGHEVNCSPSSFMHGCLCRAAHHPCCASLG